MCDTILNNLDDHSRSQGLWESWNLCSHSVVKLHEASQMFVTVDYVEETTV